MGIPEQKCILKVAESEASTHPRSHPHAGKGRTCTLHQGIRYGHMQVWSRQKSSEFARGGRGTLSPPLSSERQSVYSGAQGRLKRAMLAYPADASSSIPSTQPPPKSDNQLHIIDSLIQQQQKNRSRALFIVECFIGERI